MTLNLVARQPKIFLASSEVSDCQITGSNTSKGQLHRLSQMLRQKREAISTYNKQLTLAVDPSHANDRARYSSQTATKASITARRQLSNIGLESYITNLVASIPASGQRNSSGTQR